ncbi:MAG: hypothetical protein WA966_02050 [Ornithinimicrobium sp.]
MDVVYNVVVYAHIIGLSALIGGYLAVAGSARPGGSGSTIVPSWVMLWGARAQIITGLALVGVAEAALDDDVNHVKIGVKLVVALVVAWLVEKGSAKARRDEVVPTGMVHAAGVLAMLNAAVAVLWT